MKPEEDAQGQNHPLNDDPWQESVKFHLVRGCVHFLDFKVVGDPKTQVGDEKESDNVPAMLFGPTLLRNPLVFEVSYKQQLNGHLNQF